MVRIPILIGIVVILISIFALVYIFNSLGKLAERCKTESLQICKQLSGLTIPMIMILLIIGGFVIVVLAVVYIMLSA